MKKYTFDAENHIVIIDGERHSIYLLKKLISKEQEFRFPLHLRAKFEMAKEFFEKYPEYLL